MQSLLHCREWVGLPVTLYAMHKLIIDVTESDLVNNVDWIIVPVVNPDGYIWTHTSNVSQIVIIPQAYVYPIGVNNLLKVWVKYRYLTHTISETRLDWTQVQGKVQL